MLVGKHAQPLPHLSFLVCVKGRLHLLRSFPGNDSGCRSNRLCSVHAAKQQCPCSLGPGQAFPTGSWTALSARTCRSSRYPGRSEPPRRCALGDGGRPSLQVTVCRGGRSLGRLSVCRLYSNQTVGDAVRALQSGLLVDPSRCLPRPECSSKPMAGGVPSLAFQPRRFQGPRRPALAGGPVPRTFPAAGQMGGHL